MASDIQHCACNIIRDNAPLLHSVPDQKPTEVNESLSSLRVLIMDQSSETDADPLRG